MRGLVAGLLVVVLALTTAGCRKRVPDDAWARTLFAKRQAEIDTAAAAIEAAARGLLPIYPRPGETLQAGVSFYDARAKRCDDVRQRIHDEIMKHPTFVEMRVDMRELPKVGDKRGGTIVDPCSGLGTTWSPNEERFGDVSAENGSLVGAWRVGRRLSWNRESPAIEVWKRVDLGGEATLDLRWTIVDDGAVAKPLRFGR